MHRGWRARCQTAFDIALSKNIPFCVSQRLLQPDSCFYFDHIRNHVPHDTPIIEQKFPALYQKKK
jgi:hypothetical protein